MSLLQIPPGRPQHEPISNDATGQLTNSMEYRTYVSSISPTPESTVTYTTWDISRTSSYQLLSEARRSILSWPTGPVYQEPAKSLESSAVVPYQFRQERQSSSSFLTEPERGASPLYSRLLGLASDTRRSTLSLVP